MNRILFILAICFSVAVASLAKDIHLAPHVTAHLSTKHQSNLVKHPEASKYHLKHHRLVRRDSTDPESSNDEQNAVEPTVLQEIVYGGTMTYIVQYAIAFALITASILALNGLIAPMVFIFASLLMATFWFGWVFSGFSKNYQKILFNIKRAGKISEERKMEAKRQAEIKKNTEEAKKKKAEANRRYQASVEERKKKEEDRKRREEAAQEQKAREQLLKKASPGKPKLEEKKAMEVSDGGKAKLKTSDIPFEGTNPLSTVRNDHFPSSSRAASPSNADVHFSHAATLPHGGSNLGGSSGGFDSIHSQKAGTSSLSQIA